MASGTRNRQSARVVPSLLTAARAGLDRVLPGHEDAKTGVLLALIVIACIAAVNTMAQSTAASFDNSATELQGVLGS